MNLPLHNDRISDLSHRLQQFRINSDFASLMKSLEELLSLYTEYEQEYHARSLFPLRVYDDLLSDLIELLLPYATPEQIDVLENLELKPQYVLKQVLSTMRATYLQALLRKSSSVTLPFDTLLTGISISNQLDNRAFSDHLIKKLIEAYPNRKEGMIFQADLLLKNRKFQAAYEFLLSQPKTFRDQSYWQLRVAVCLMNLGYLKEAVVGLSKMRTVETEYLDMQFQLGELAMHLPSNPDWSYFRRLIRQFPEHMFATYLEAEQLRRSGELQKAQEIYHKLKSSLYANRAYPHPNQELERKVRQRLIQFYGDSSSEWDRRREIWEFMMVEGFAWDYVPTWAEFAKSSDKTEADLGSPLIGRIPGLQTGFDEKGTYMVSSARAMGYLLSSGSFRDVSYLKIHHPSVDLRTTLRAMTGYHWPKLKSLSISFPAFNDLGLLDLLQASFWPGLESVEFESGNLTASGLREMFHKWPSNLNNFAIRNQNLKDSIPDIAPSLLVIMKQVPSIKKLQSLNLELCKLNSDDLAGLFSIPFNRLGSLSVSGNELGTDTLFQLQTASWFSSLETLNLSFTQIEKKVPEWLRSQENSCLQEVRIEGDWTFEEYIPHADDQRLFFGEIQVEEKAT